MRTFAYGFACAVWLSGCCGSVTGAADPLDGSPMPALDSKVESTADAAPPSDAAAPPGPSELFMTCPMHGAPLAIKLPCLVGLNLLGDHTAPGLHVLECALRDAPEGTVIGVMIPLVELPSKLNEQLVLPFEDVPPPPGYKLTLAGNARFTEVDPSARAFRARVLNGVVRGTSSEGDSERDACTVIDQPLWAVAGDFL